jgi:hypothetical protein
MPYTITLTTSTPTGACPELTKLVVTSFMEKKYERLAL